MLKATLVTDKYQAYSQQDILIKQPKQFGKTEQYQVLQRKRLQLKIKSLHKGDSSNSKDIHSKITSQLYNFQGQDLNQQGSNESFDFNSKRKKYYNNRFSYKIPEQQKQQSHGRIMHQDQADSKFKQVKQVHQLRQKAQLVRQPPSSIERIYLPENNMGEKIGENGPVYNQEVEPVYRNSTYDAEKKYQGQYVKELKILFLDEGNVCRSILAESIMCTILAENPQLSRYIQVHSASIGPSNSDKSHDSRVLQTLCYAKLPVPPKHYNIFNEVEDIVKYDLVLTMDSFDFKEVFKELATLEQIYPEGVYSSKMHLLGEFLFLSKVHKHQLEQPKITFKDQDLDFKQAFSINNLGDRVWRKYLQDCRVIDIKDPLYGNMGDQAEIENLIECLQNIKYCCLCLMNYFQNIRQRMTCQIGFKQAVVQTLKCPLLSGLKNSRIQWAKNRNVKLLKKSKNGGYIQYQDLKNFHELDGSRKNNNSKGYWQQEENVIKEIRKWMEQYGVNNRPPTRTELRLSNRNSLCKAIYEFGGSKHFSEVMNLNYLKKPQGYWDQFENLQQELQDLIEYNQQGQRCLPRLKILKSKKRYDLIAALKKHGGSVRVASLLGLQLYVTTPSSQEKKAEKNK